MDAFILPPARMPFPFRIALWFARRRAGTELLPARLLIWHPRAAISSGILEALITHRQGLLTERLLKMVRMTVSFTTSCEFCIGLNSQGWEALISEQELSALQGRTALGEVPTLSAAEVLAIEYARLTSATPLAIPASIGQRLRDSFSEREIVALAATSAQVNYWARLIQGLGCPPEG